MHLLTSAIACECTWRKRFNNIDTNDNLTDISTYDCISSHNYCFGVASTYRYHYQCSFTQVWDTNAKIHLSMLSLPTATTYFLPHQIWGYLLCKNETLTWIQLYKISVLVSTLFLYISNITHLLNWAMNHSFIELFYSFLPTSSSDVKRYAYLIVLCNL